MHHPTRYGVSLPNRPFPFYYDSQLTPVSAYEWGPSTFKTSSPDPKKPPGNSSVRGPKGSDPSPLRGPTTGTRDTSQASGSQCFQDSSTRQGLQDHLTQVSLDPDPSDYNSGTSYESLMPGSDHGTGPIWSQRALPRAPLLSTLIRTSPFQEDVQDRAWPLTNSLQTESEEQLLLQTLSLMAIPDDLIHPSIYLASSVDPGVCHSHA